VCCGKYFRLLGKLGKWNTEQSAILFRDQDPSEVIRLLRFPERVEEGHRLNRKAWQREIYQTYSILEFADATDWRRYVDTDADVYFFYNHPKKASPAVFMSLANYLGINIPEKLKEAHFSHLKNIDDTKKREAMVAALGAYKSPQKANQANPEIELDDHHKTSGIENLLSESIGYEEAFEPLPLTTIANMFPLEKGGNIGSWKSLADNAKRNGLVLARVDSGAGRRESTFNPWLVGEWLIRNKGFTSEKIYRKRMKNLPPGSEDIHNDIMSLLGD
jgi:hypothetical protein